MPTPRSRPAAAMVLAAALAAVGLGPAATPAAAATVPVGAGSYSDTRPPGTSGPTTNTGAPVTPRSPPPPDKPVPTNDWWSSLAFQRYGDNPYSTPMYGHPLTYQATSGGLEVGYPTTPASSGRAASTSTPTRRDLTVGLSGLNSPDTKADDWSDWTVTPYWADGARTCAPPSATACRSCTPKGSGGDARITTAGTPTVFADQGNVLGITVAGHHYALFAPDRQRLERLRHDDHRRARRQGLLLARRAALHGRARDLPEVRVQLRHRLQGGLGRPPAARSRRPTS